MRPKGVIDLVLGARAIIILVRATLAGHSRIDGAGQFAGNGCRRPQSVSTMDAWRVRAISPRGPAKMIRLTMSFSATPRCSGWTITRRYFRNCLVASPPEVRWPSRCPRTLTRRRIALRGRSRHPRRGGIVFRRAVCANGISMIWRRITTSSRPSPPRWISGRRNICTSWPMPRPSLSGIKRAGLRPFWMRWPMISSGPISTA